MATYAREQNWILDCRMSYTGQVPDGTGADGVLCGHVPRADVTGLVRGLSVPVVGLGICGNGVPSCVSCCDESIGRAAARHLLDRGYRSLAFCRQRDTEQEALRLKGFQAQVEAAGERFVSLAPPDGAPASGSAASMREWIAPMLSTLRVPIAVMVGDDLDAISLVDALVGCGYSVPEQVAVISAGNDPILCDVAPVAVSSVDVRSRDVGYEGARLLDQLIDGRPRPAQPVLVEPGPVHTRVSTDIMALPNLHAARALRFIWTRYRSPINVDSVSAHVPVTRRRLQTLFHDHLGRTMQEEIARVRIADACLMLKKSKMRIREIATLTGFKSSLHFHRTSQSVLEMGPKAFRETGSIPDFGVLPAQVGDQLPVA
ncbi:MAG: substrate-binding domain-containing protein [Kiritimatiellae bacterium]|nr:substrate-binding domain-containing protein [Kiritimatiellia bacterium]